MPDVKIIDRYVLRLAFWPLAGALMVTLIALLLERVLRLLDLLQSSANRFGFVAELAANLIPHYLGLTLPAAFFIALFLVVSRMNQDSEIDALLANGVSLSRMAVPYVGLGLVLMMISLIVFGLLQPYSRYAFRAVMHSAENAGWNGELPSQMIISPNDHMTMTADAADPAGRKLTHVFIRRINADGQEEVTTAASGELARAADGKSVTVRLTQGQQLRLNKRDQPEVLSFNSLSIQAPLAGAAKLLRARGGDERELTLWELIREANRPNSVMPHRVLLAELYARLARACSLPFLPLLALPLGIAAKRGGRGPGIIIAGLLLMAFQHLLQLGQSLAIAGRMTAWAGVGMPFVIFVLLCLLIFGSSRKRPGDNPINRASEEIAFFFTRMAKRMKPRSAKVRAA